MTHRVTTSLLSACVLGASAAYAAASASALSVSTGATASVQSTNVVETRINADQMEFDYAEQIVYLRGNVVVTDPRGILKSDNATVEFDKDKQSGGATQGENVGDFKRVIANGNVRMISGTRMAVSDKAIWTYSENRIVLTGDKQRPLVKESKEGKDVYMLTSDRIIYDVKAQKFDFQPNPSIIMQPSEGDKNRFLESSTATKPGSTGAGNEKK